MAPRAALRLWKESASIAAASTLTVVLAASQSADTASIITDSNIRLAASRAKSGTPTKSATAGKATHFAGRREVSENRVARFTTSTCIAPVRNRRWITVRNQLARSRSTDSVLRCRAWQHGIDELRPARDVDVLGSLELGVVLARNSALAVESSFRSDA